MDDEHPARGAPDPGAATRAAADVERTLAVPRSATPGSASSGPSVPSAGGRALPPGTVLRHFEIRERIGEGGFGIVYLAFDRQLERRVAIKEYMPAALAVRGPGLAIEPVSDEARTTFAAGLAGFVNEARLLARFDHPNLVKVLEYWEANGTAYMAMPFYEGVPLRKALADLGGPPTEAWLKALLRPLCDALGAMHAHDCLHRDLSPENILIQPSGAPLLLDFGAARRVIGDRTQMLTVILRPGYAPIEQYAESSEGGQGPWSDVYALAAVVRFAITGQPPKTSIARAIVDDVVPLSSVAEGRYDRSFLAALDRALSLRAQDRPQRMGEFVDELGLVPTAAARAEPPRAEATRVRARKPAWMRAVSWPAGVAAVVVIVLALSWGGPDQKNGPSAPAGVSPSNGAGGDARESSPPSPSVRDAGGTMTPIPPPAGDVATRALPATVDVPVAAQPEATVPQARMTAVMSPPSPVPRAARGEERVRTTTTGAPPASAPACADWLNRLQLGEVLGDAELARFRKECGR